MHTIHILYLTKWCCYTIIWSLKFSYDSLTLQFLAIAIIRRLLMPSPVHGLTLCYGLK